MMTVFSVIKVTKKSAKEIYDYLYKTKYNNLKNSYLENVAKNPDTYWKSNSITYKYVCIDESRKAYRWLSVYDMEEDSYSIIKRFNSVREFFMSFGRYEI